MITALRILQRYDLNVSQIFNRLPQEPSIDIIDICTMLLDLGITKFQLRSMNFNLDEEFWNARSTKMQITSYKSVGENLGKRQTDPKKLS